MDTLKVPEFIRASMYASADLTRQKLPAELLENEELSGDILPDLLGAIGQARGIELKKALAVLMRKYEFDQSVPDDFDQRTISCDT